MTSAMSNFARKSFGKIVTYEKLTFFDLLLRFPSDLHERDITKKYQNTFQKCTKSVSYE